MAGGFYQMHRGWMENPVFAGESFSRGQAWCWLIENAVWKERKIDVLGRTVTLERGQLCYSTRYLATAWGWSEAKVRRFTTRLKTDAMIDAETDAGQTLITICNYDKYQATPDTSDAPSDALRDAEATHERRTSDANKNKGKEREEGNKALSDERAYTCDPKHADSGPLSDETQTTDSQPSLPSIPAPSSKSAKNASKVKPSDEDIDRAFDVFWLKVYPNRKPHARGDKRATRKKFGTVIKRENLAPDFLLERAAAYAHYAARHIADPKHIKMAITWLNNSGWAEDHEETNHDQNPKGRQVGHHHRKSGKRNSASDNWLAGASANLSREHSEPENR